MGSACSPLCTRLLRRILIDPMPYRSPGDLYYVWRDYGPIVDISRRNLGATDIAELQKAGGIIESAVGVQRLLGGVFSLGESADPNGDRRDVHVAEPVRSAWRRASARPRLCAR